MALVEPIGTEFVINTTGAPGQPNPGSIQFSPAVTALKNGGFVVAWSDFNSNSADDPSGGAVRAQIYDAQAFRAGGEFRINEITQNAQEQPDIGTIEADGSFIVIWQHYYSQTDSDIIGRRYSQEGVPLSDEIEIEADA